MDAETRKAIDKINAAQLKQEGVSERIARTQERQRIIRLLLRDGRISTDLLQQLIEKIENGYPEVDWGKPEGREE